MTYDFCAPGCQTLCTGIWFKGSASDRPFLIAAWLVFVAGVVALGPTISNGRNKKISSARDPNSRGTRTVVRHVCVCVVRHKYDNDNICDGVQSDSEPGPLMPDPGASHTRPRGLSYLIDPGASHTRPRGLSYQTPGPLIPDPGTKKLIIIGSAN